MMTPHQKADKVWEAYQRFLQAENGEPGPPYREADDYTVHERNDVLELMVKDEGFEVILFASFEYMGRGDFDLIDIVFIDSENPDGRKFVLLPQRYIKP